MLPVKPGSPTKPVPGYDVRVLDEDGDEVAAGETGNIVIKLPLPPGCLPTLWNNDAGYDRLVPVARIPATTSRATPATRTRTATSTS